MGRDQIRILGLGLEVIAESGLVAVFEEIDVGLHGPVRRLRVVQPVPQIVRLRLQPPLTLIFLSFYGTKKKFYIYKHIYFKSRRSGFSEKEPVCQSEFGLGLGQFTTVIFRRSSI